MSVTASSAFTPPVTHPTGAPSIPDQLSLKAKLRYSPWSSLTTLVIAEMGYLKCRDGKPFTYKSSLEESAESESQWD